MYVQSATKDIHKNRAALATVLIRDTEHKVFSLQVIPFHSATANKLNSQL